jgi:hypothetical protein
MVTFIKIRSHRRKLSNSDSVEQKTHLKTAFYLHLKILKFLLKARK